VCQQLPDHAAHVSRSPEVAIKPAIGKMIDEPDLSFCQGRRHVLFLFLMWDRLSSLLIMGYESQNNISQGHNRHCEFRRYFNVELLQNGYYNGHPNVEIHCF